MKNTTLLLLVFMTFFTLNAQDAVPSQALRAYQDLNTGIEDPFWEFREGSWVAMYADEEGLKKVFFDEDGKWLETRLRIAQQSLPTGVRTFINTHYRDADITYIGLVSRQDDAVYRIESELPSAVVIKLLDATGRLLEEETIGWNGFSAQRSDQFITPLPETRLPAVVRE